MEGPAMSFSQWKSVVYKLRTLAGFIGLYIIISIILTAISFVILFVIFVDPNDPDLGRAAAAIIPIVLSPIIGMTVALVVMYFWGPEFPE
jgi:hypothetical protein